MLNKILVPLDGSELAEGALSLATGLSIPTAAHLVLVRTVTAHSLPGVDQREPQVHALAEAQIYLREIAHGLADRGFVVETATPYGNTPAAWISEEVRLRRADIIVMSTHGRTGPGHLLFGSVAESVVARSAVPVLLQRAWDPRPRELLLGDRPRLLATLDGSKFSESVLPTAARLADDLGAELTLLKVQAGPEDRSLEGVQDYLDEVSLGVSEQWPSLNITTRVEFGDAADRIAAASTDSQFALVVMATHGRTGMLRATVGSVAGRVLERGTTPLVLVRGCPERGPDSLT